MKFTRIRYIMISHTNVIVSHSVFSTYNHFLKMFDRCRPFHETKFRIINVCTENRTIVCIFPPFPWCKCSSTVSQGKNHVKCIFQTMWFCHVVLRILRHWRQKLSIINYLSLCWVWMAADGEYVTEHCLCMYNTDINISCNWHMILV